jgi:hypothetical protein
MGAGAVLFLAVFLPWFSVSPDSSGPHPSFSLVGLDLSFTAAWLPGLLGLAVAGLVATRALGGRQLPRLPASWSQVQLFVGSVAAVLVLHKLAVGERVHGFGYVVDRSIGIYVALLASLALVGGAVLQVLGEKAIPRQPRAGSTQP